MTFTTSTEFYCATHGKTMPLCSACNPVRRERLGAR